MFLASNALFFLDPRILKQYSNDRSRVMRISHPKKCVLVATRLDDGHLADAPSTLEDAPGGGMSMNPAFAMASTTTYIYRIFCSPGISASSISANTGIFSVFVVGLLRYWVSISRSGRSCPTPPSCFLVLFPS
uniref:Uncharacterized protein n=1 Tax=Populus davidiana TaxID=266767 RepID=A0A6M2F019_9ROSI